MTPELAFVFDLRFEFEHRFDYQSMSGRRGFTDLKGGTVEGPRFTGIVYPGGGDWPLFRDDGVAEFDSRHFIRAEDGTNIYMRNRGIHRGTLESVAAIRAGEAPPEGSYYLRCAPIFDAPVGPHDWLTKTTFVGVGEHLAGGVAFKMFEVL